MDELDVTAAESKGDLQRDSGLCVGTPSVEGIQSLYRTGEAEVRHHRAGELP